MGDMEKELHELNRRGNLFIICGFVGSSIPLTETLAPREAPFFKKREDASR